MSARFPAVLVVILALVPAVPAQNALNEEGVFVSVSSPITSDVVARIKLRVDAARNNPSRPVRKVVFDFTPGDKDANTTDFGACFELADYIQSLGSLQTIAYLSAPVAGHTVLPVLACQDIVTSRSAKLGEIFPNSTESPRETVLAGYRDILSAGREQYRAVARKMMDRAVSLGKGSKNGADYYVDLRDKAKLEKEGIVITDPTPLPFGLPGMAGVFDSNALKLLGLVSVTAESRNELAGLYSLAPSSLRDDPLDGRAPVAYRYVLQGPIDGAVRESVLRVVREIGRQKGNLLFLVLECSGGDISAATDLAERLIELRDEPDPVKVVAVIPDRAPDTAAIIALGCSEIVMSRRKDAKDAEPREAEIGDFEPVIGNAPKDRVDLLKRSLKSLAEKQGYPELIVEGMVDRDLEIVRVHSATDRSRSKLLTREQFDAEKANWVSDGVVKAKGQLLKLNATKAAELNLARHVVDNSDINSVYAVYGLDAAKVKEATPSAIDRFATFLRIPGVTVLLVVIGFVGLILEMKLPGTTVPGIIAALAFILVFWSQSQFTGQNAVLGGLVFLLGLVLVLLEVFVIPGFGVTGIVGIFFMLGGIGLATFDRVPSSGEDWMLFGSRVSQYVGALFGATVIAFILARYLPNIPYANRMMLQPPPDAGSQADLPGVADAAALLGAIGTSATPLRPAGMAEFGEKYVDVVSEGGFIESGARIQVIEVEGMRIVVKQV